MKRIPLFLILLFISLNIHAQESVPQPNPQLKLKANKNLYLIGMTAFSEDSFMPSAGIQAAKLLELTYHDKNVVYFNVDFAGIMLRKQYDANNLRPGVYLSGSFNKKIFSIGGYVFSAANRTLIDYGKNQFKPEGFVEDNAFHFEISNLTGISVNTYLFKRQKAKILAYTGITLSNIEKPRFGYLVSIIKVVTSGVFLSVKADNNTSIGHKLSVGVMYVLH